MGGWEGGIRVPSIIRWPKRFPSGAEVSVATSHMDLLPTFAAVTGAALPSDRPIDGRNLLPLLTGMDSTLIPHEFLFHYCGTSMHAARWTPQDGESQTQHPQLTSRTIY